MRIFLLGGTGSIGSAVLRALVDDGQDVIGLARSDKSATEIAKAGGVALPGNIETAESWIGDLPPVDAVVHLACDFHSLMAEIDRNLLDILLAHPLAGDRRPKLIYTGGCWLYGQTGDRVATEQSPFNPLPAFGWMVPHSNRVLASPQVDGVVIHPGMVYSGGGGVFASFAQDAVAREAIRIVGGEHVRWPLVHADDLAMLYLLALKGAPARSSYFGVSVHGHPVGRIARAFASRFATPSPEPEIISADAIAAELGEWARGYALDQRLSGLKAMRQLGWTPRHTDPEQEILHLPMPGVPRASRPVSANE